MPSRSNVCKWLRARSAGVLLAAVITISAATASAVAASAMAAPAGSAVTQFNARDGHRVRLINRAADRFSNADAMVRLGSDVFIANDGNWPDGGHGGTVTEISATTGKLVRVINLLRYQKPGESGPDVAPVLAAADGRVYVAISMEITARRIFETTVDELSARSGKLIRSESRVGNAIVIDAMAARGNDLFIGFSLDNVIEYNGTTGKEVRKLPVADSSDYVGGLAFFRGDLVITNSAADGGNGTPGTPVDSVSEVNAGNGKLVRTVSAAADEFSAAEPVATAGDDILVGNNQGNTITVLNGNDGKLVRVINRVQSPDRLAVSGDDVLVDGGHSTVDEVAIASGRHVRTLRPVTGHANIVVNAVLIADGSLFTSTTW